MSSIIFPIKAYLSVTIYKRYWIKLDGDRKMVSKTLKDKGSIVDHLTQWCLSGCQRWTSAKVKFALIKAKIKVKPLKIWYCYSQSFKIL